MTGKWRFLDLMTIEDGRDIMDIIELNGTAPGTPSRFSGTYCTADLSEPGSTFPLVCPAKGASRSFAKTSYLQVWDGKLFQALAECSEVKDICIFIPQESPFGPCQLIADEWQLSTKGEGGVVIGQRDDGENGMPLKEYVPAGGDVGYTGEPLEDYHPYYMHQNKPIRKIDCFSQAKPCILDKTVYSDAFRSKAAVTQVIVPASTTPGQKPTIEVHWGAWVR